VSFSQVNNHKDLDAFLKNQPNSSPITYMPTQESGEDKITVIKPHFSSVYKQVSKPETHQKAKRAIPRVYLPSKALPNPNPNPLDERRKEEEAERKEEDSTAR
jgi:hypothetical protein